MDKKIVFIAGIVLLVLIGVSIYISSFYGEVELLSKTPKTTAEIKNKKYRLPKKVTLRKDTQHTVKLSAPGYFEKTETITTEQKRYTFELESSKDKAISAMPVYEKSFDITYNKKDDFFTVIIKEEPKKEKEEEAIKYLKELGLDTEKEEVIFDSVAGVGNKVGP